MSPGLIGQRMTQNMGKVRLRTAGWEASREWLWSCCQGELGLCILPAHSSTNSRAPTTPAGGTQGNVVILNISKPPCWAPFPDSVVALALLEEQGRNLPRTPPAPERFSSSCSVRTLKGTVQELQWASFPLFSHQTQPEGQLTSPGGATAH